MFFHLFPYFCAVIKVIRGQLALREHFRAKPTATVHFHASFGVRTLLCVAMQLTGWEAGLPGHQDGYLPF